MIDEHCNPKLADFGLSTLYGAGSSTMGGLTGGTTRFMAPELLLGEGVQVSFSADMYAFACLCIEVCPNAVMPFGTDLIPPYFLSSILENTHFQISLLITKSSRRSHVGLVRAYLQNPQIHWMGFGRPSNNAGTAIPSCALRCLLWYHPFPFEGHYIPLAIQRLSAM